MNSLKFAANYNNKLNCNYYTTIREMDASDLYFGEVVEIYLDGEFHHHARILSFECTDLEEVAGEVIIMDTGKLPKDAIDLIRGFYDKVWGNCPDKDCAIVIYTLGKVTQDLFGEWAWL